MATSGTYTWTSSRNSIIRDALRKVGALGDYETLDDVRLQVGIDALNPMIKKFQTLGMPLWATTQIEIPLSFWASASEVNIGPSQAINQLDKPLKVLQALRGDASDETELNIYTWTDYNNLSDKTMIGAPVHLFYQPLRTTGRIALWPRPDTYWQTKTLYLRYQRPFQDMNSSTDEPDFPVEWHEALIYNLAVRLAPTYGLPPAERAALNKEAKDILDETKSFDQEEGSLFIIPRYV
jgi:hypothetical protein